MSTAASLPAVSIQDIEFHAESLDVEKAAAAYREYGALVVRGLTKQYIPAIAADIDRVIDQTLALIDQAQPCPEGWTTPNGSLLLPAPENFPRDKQIMTLPINYRNSSAFFWAALDSRTLDLVEAILGPDIELFNDGQSLVKEPVGGHPKNLHQDAAYFEHKYEGPVAALSYVVPTDENNGCLHVIPGSHKLGVIEHEDTFSHLGLNEQAWPWEKSLPITGQPGDAIVFHVNTIHGSKPNGSQGRRPVFISRYRRADDYVVVNATSADNRDEAEKRKQQARKENQMGLLVRGFRKWEQRG